MPSINITLSEDDYERLTKLASKKGKTKVGLLRDALALEEWFDETKRDGDRVLVERSGKLREVVRR